MLFRTPGWLTRAVFALALTALTHSASAQDSTAFWRTDGPDILNPAGEPVVLRGLGLGGWLVPEGYMLDIAAPDGGSPSSIRAQIEDLIGPGDTERFYEIYRANYVDEKDVAQIAEWGFDHLRLPFHYRLFYDPDTDTFDEEGFALLDTFLDWCRTYGLGVILDMHAAPGAQNAGPISDSDGVARLWTEPEPYQDQTVAIWTEIARRYADEPLIIGYDLINEPVTPDGVTGMDLRALYVRLRDAVRAVDPNHILFIEGNYYATTFDYLTPPFDDNMVYAFHKYWNGTGISSIQYLLDIRSQHNVPLWLGESGENSNPWFYRVVRLMESHGIGWNWWTHKQIEATASLFSAPYAPGYETVLRYWRGEGPRPAVSTARNGLFRMAAGLDMDSCVTRPGVLAALMDPDFGALRQPVAEHVIPGTINAVEYDLGNQGVTYSDSDVMATQGTPGGGNNGAQLRNDGVDIERSTDPQGFIYNVGWMERLEWLTYTVNVETAGRYDVEIRVASSGGDGQMRLLLDDARLGDDLTIPDTGGWQNWISIWLRDAELPAGTHILKLLVRRNGFNVNRMNFVLVEATAAEPTPTAPEGVRLLGHYPEPVRDAMTVRFTSDRPARARVTVFDALGREVHVRPWQSFGAGTHALRMRARLAPGAYVYRLEMDDGLRRYALPRAMVVVR